MLLLLLTWPELFSTGSRYFSKTRATPSSSELYPYFLYRVQLASVASPLKRYWNLVLWCNKATAQFWHDSECGRQDWRLLECSKRILGCYIKRCCYDLVSFYISCFDILCRLGLPSVVCHPLTQDVSQLLRKQGSVQITSEASAGVHRRLHRSHSSAELRWPRLWLASWHCMCCLPRVCQEIPWLPAWRTWLAHMLDPATNKR